MTTYLVPVKHGRAGNNIFQIAEAAHLARIFPETQLVPFEIAELEISSDVNLQEFVRNLSSVTAFSPHEVEEIIREKSEQGKNYVIYLDYLNISPIIAIKEVDYLRSLFKSQIFGKSSITNSVIHIRAGDIWGSIRHRRRPLHPDYYPLPLNYYKLIKETLQSRAEIVAEAGSPIWYRKSIDRIFKPDRTVVSRNLNRDFLQLTNCKTLVLSVSTLSWIASLLGRSEVLHYPNLGLFNSRVRDDLLFFPPKPSYSYEFEDHVWGGGSRLDKEWLHDSIVRVTGP